jgi:tRNA A37 threonylcarbamoyladenosine dehydratase
VEKLNLFVDQHSLQQVLTPRPDLLIDAIDTIGPKIELLAAARQQGVPVISSMGAALRTDPALIRTADLFETSNCPLARRMRKKLRGRGIGQGIICVYSLEVAHSDFHKQRPGSRDEEPGGKRILGSLPTITAIFGLTMANLALAQLADG